MVTETPPTTRPGDDLGAGPASGLRTPPEPALPGSRLAELDPERRMKIGEVAERLGLSLRSIRYYEETGLVTPSARTPGGFRLYSELDVQRLLLIMQMKPLEFSLEEMGGVLGDLDVVQGRADASADEEAAARSRLRAIEIDVARRWATLRQRLEIASMFRDLLADELGTLTRDDAT